MQEKKPCDGKELICINVDKVFDWVVKEMSFDISVPNYFIEFTPKDLVPEGEIKGATVTCEVTPARHHPVVILGREDRPFCIDGKNVLLQQLNVRKNFDVRIIVTLSTGTVLTSKYTIPVSRCEQVTLCAPAGTDVEITYTRLDCFACNAGKLFGKPTWSGSSPGDAPVIEEGADGPEVVRLGWYDGKIKFTNLTISASTCQSIQSTFPVTVEFLADYCEPRADLVSACSPPTRPHQCSVVFPEGGGHCCN